MRDGKICESCIKGNFFPGIINRCYRDSYFDSAMLAIIQWASRFFKVIPDKVSKFVALTEFAKSKYIEMGIPSSKIRIKPNFTKDYANSTQDVLNEGLYVGRLSKEKGIDVLVQAIELVPNFTLHVVGDGPLMGLVENHPQIQYYGWQDQSIISQLMATCSFLIMPSMWYEGLPRTLIEAYAHGLPIISSRIGSLKDLIDDGKTGYLFEPGDSISLARLIESALTNQEKMLSFRKNCVELYKSHFSAKVNYKILINIYANTIAERS
jgi:glycosyltransferase involved in cell wall biosynthesis